MASINQSLPDLFEKYRYDRNIVKKSNTWFQQQINLLQKQRITPQQVLKNNPLNNKSVISAGNLYMFVYDAKNKETLPYWDKFPLVFPFRSVKGGFYGLNMHYLPYKLRVQLMDRLLVFKTNSKFDETTKLRYSWAMINGVSKFQMAEPCVKHYLYDHVRSPFTQVYTQDWPTAMMLPVEKFVGASTSKVWQDSRKAFA